MDTQVSHDAAALPIELIKAASKFDRAQKRIEDNMGAGETDAGLAITQEYIGVLAEAFRAKLTNPGPDFNKEEFRPLIVKLRELEPEVVAMCVLQACLRTVAEGVVLRDTLLRIGGYINGELWAAGLTGYDRKLAKRIAEQARRSHGNLKSRQAAAVKLARAGGYNVRAWTTVTRFLAGEWCFGVLTTALPDLFERVEEGDEQKLTLCAPGWAIADRVIANLVTMRPVWTPLTVPPRSWTGFNAGGVWDERLSLSLNLLRVRKKATEREVSAAIKAGTMRPALDALNALQAVPWSINTKVLGVMRACIERGIAVKSLPPPSALPFPTDKERADWGYRAAMVKLANVARIGDLAMLSEDVATAEAMEAAGRFWVPMNADWRGRVYGVPSFNFQRDDRVRGLFLFADGEPIGEEGIHWLKVHLANCGDFSKCSKKPFKDRVAWVEQFLPMIRKVAEAPVKDPALIGPTQGEAWMYADKPFLFLAACMELAGALLVGPSFLTRLPVSWDGSCSGLQHLCAMTRAAEGSLVNLTPQEKPQDVYQTVAERTVLRLAEDTEKPQLAKMCLDYGIGRSEVKRNVMTYSYSSKKFGMAQQQQEDLMKPLSQDVISEKLEEHPFGPDNGYSASIYLAGHVYAAIEDVVEKPAQAMAFLQKLAEAMVSQGKPVRWTSPAGIPWTNIYNNPECKRISLWLHDRGVKVRHRIKVAVADSPKIAAKKVVSAIAPNFVHACDAAHLLRTVNAAVSEGIVGLAMVHDSFGCLASRAGRFRRLIREEFVRMYQEHDVLGEVLQCAQRDMGDTPLEVAAPERGPLELNDVLDAEYAFA